MKILLILISLVAAPALFAAKQVRTSIRKLGR